MPGIESSMRIAVVLSAYDKMSGQINAAVNKVQSKLTGFSKKMNSLADGSYQTGKELVASGLAIGAPIVAATKKAMDFEDAMANVAKVANLDRASQEFKGLSSDALQLSKYLATNADDVGTLYSSLLSGGTAITDLSKVAQIAGEASVAFDMTQESAGDAFMTMKNAMALTVDETKKAFDATNAITNKFGGKASDILFYMSSGGASVARTLKATAPEMEAFGRALMQSGVAAGEAGTVMERFRVGLYKNAEAKRIFDKAGGGAKGIAAVFEAAKKTGDPFKWFQAHSFGQYSSNMALLSGNLGNLQTMLKYVGDESNYLGSANQEFANRTTTTSFKLNQLKQSFYAAAISAGGTLLPILKSLADKFAPLMDKVGKFIEKNPGLVKGIITAAAGFSALALTGGYFAFVIGGVAKFLDIGATAFSFVAKSIGFVVKAFQFLRLVILANPVIAIIAGIAVAAFLIYKYWDKIKEFFKMVWEGVKKIFAATWQWIKQMFLNYTPQGLIIKHWSKITAFFSNLWAGVKAVFMGMVNWITGLGITFYNAGKNIITSIWNGIKAMVNKPIEAVKSMVGKIRNLLPFSPAKDGPLKDIHRIRLVETIAESIKPASLVNKMNRVAKLTYNAIAKPQGRSVSAIGSTGSGVTMNITINLSGSATKQDGQMIASEIKKQFSQLMKKYNQQQSRVSF